MKIKHLIGATLLFYTVVCSNFVSSVSAERKQVKNNSIDAASRRDLVSAWQKHDPAVTPFIGSWLNYESESSWNIYPSATKGRACIIRRSSDYASFDIGEVKSGKIYTRSGQVIFPEGKYLGVASSQNGSINKIPLQDPRSLKDPSSFEYITNFNPTRVIQAYRKAGCTASLPKNNNVSQTNIENLADGFYLYGEVPNANGFGKHYVVFGKSDKTITGYSYVTNTDNIYCFQGTARGNQIVNATSITTIINPPNSYEQVSLNQSVNLNGFYPIKNSEESKRKSVESCVSKINQNITNNTVPQTIRVPDSFKLTLDNGMKTEFVKGQDGYYTWFVTNYVVSNTCLGLTNNQNPAKIKLAPYGCNSKRKAKKWEIVMANNNTGYKVKLPNTPHCLANNVGIVDCNNSQATVINLTPQQLKDFTVNTRP